MTSNKIYNYRLNRAIHHDIRIRMARKKRGYQLWEIIQGIEADDGMQLVLLKQVFPDIYTKIEKEELSEEK